ncbi:hypothetical protein [Psychromonas sp. CNPT3]|uniref:hypothetical protein n=1 Tax=Psychromonas sp. CNPT3 TaxID=314282 RepID=UPI0012EA87EB|nr:hypothetical protein [Psychromonas sp. CNPT3]
MLFIIILLFSAPTLFAKHSEPCVEHKVNTSLIDNTYHYFNKKFCQPAAWFDNFFADKRSLEDARAGTILRWYDDLSLTEQGEIKQQMKLNAHLHLPKLNHKLKLLIGSYISPLDSPTTNADQDNSQLALRYDWIAQERTSFNVKVTAHPSIGFRYRYSYPVHARVVLSFTQKLQQRRRINAASSQFDIDFSIDPLFLLRWSHEVQIKKNEVGIKLSSEATLYQYISSTKAINYHAHLHMKTRPQQQITEHYLSVSYRHNVFRKWFFYTLTPSLKWQHEDITRPTKEATFTLRLEVLFTNL